MGVFALLSIQLSNRVGIEKSLFIAMALILVATLARGFLSSSWLLLATSLISGIGIGIAGPLISGFIKLHFPGSLGVASVYSLSLVIGAALATTFSIPLFHLMNDSWQWSLGFWGVLALLGAVFMLPLLTKGKQIQTGGMPSLKITNKRVYLFLLFFGCMSAMFYSITAWLAPVAQSMGMSAAQSGLVLTLFTVIQIPVSFLLPIVVGRKGNRKRWLLLCAVSELIGVALLLGHMSVWAATVFLGMGAGGLFPLALLLPLGEASTPEEATSWSAQTQFGGYLIGSTGPFVIGLTLDIFDNSYTPALVAMMVVLVILICTVWKIEQKKQLEISQ
ncbi:MFS transporter [Brevibacillus centrosporus]|uniref:MFS transporter, CP family, cyanate transporter n=1 Tax=Brevibacillus centrosporus TaxID=54910 RepID=A0A1I3MIF9_9BACL|nr:MFS transporter [Brevibacillus centrosporus]SFI96773.1 MFS transporter, CP family, cyanate transporter [Brevibacillus centrosporus]